MKLMNETIKIVGSIGKLKFNPKDNCVWDIIVLDKDGYKVHIKRPKVVGNQIHILDNIDKNLHDLTCDGYTIDLIYAVE
jgi:hypothetical protein